MKLLDDGYIDPYLESEGTEICEFCKQLTDELVFYRRPGFAAEYLCEECEREFRERDEDEEDEENEEEEA